MESNNSAVRVSAKKLCDLSNQALKRELADEQLRRLLVAADLAERDGARSVAVRFLYAAIHWWSFSRLIENGLNDVARLLACGTASGLLSTSHVC